MMQSCWIPSHRRSTYFHLIWICWAVLSLEGMIQCSRMLLSYTKKRKGKQSLATEPCDAFFNWAAQTLLLLPKAITACVCVCMCGESWEHAWPAWKWWIGVLVIVCCTIWKSLFFVAFLMHPHTCPPYPVCVLLIVSLNLTQQMLLSVFMYILRKGWLLWEMEAVCLHLSTYYLISLHNCWWSVGDGFSIYRVE